MKILKNCFDINKIKVKDCSFDIGGMVYVNELIVFKQHGLYIVRGFNKLEKHVNRAFKTLKDVKIFLKDQATFFPKTEIY